MWLYGSGFPKSLNIGKAVDKLQGNEREVLYQKNGLVKSKSEIIKWNTDLTPNVKKVIDETKGQSEWEGWGTALKPANEPICLARKPLSEKSVVENVLKWKTGGINIDDCRVDLNGDNTSRKITENKNDINVINSNKVGSFDDKWKEGRFPANIILECLCDEVIKGEKGEWKKTYRSKSGEIYGGGKGTNVVETGGYTGDKGDIHTNPMCPCYMLDEQSGFSKTNCKAGIVDKSTRTTQGAVFVDKDGKPTTGHKQIINASTINDKGGASRFFYQAKVSKAERNMGLDLVEGKEVVRQGLAGEHNNPIHKNNHPTVKPINLMTYLCRLITPEGGIVLDPFMGSGSTGIAARLEGFRFLGMEMDADYFKIAEARIENFEQYRKFIKKI
jgi:site-specific DNA-methyltransferase (adenine-specific)